MAVFTTFITTPLVVMVYKPARFQSKVNYKHRTIKRKDPDSQLRILSCFHSMKNVPTMLNLIESSRGTEKHGLCVYMMHLMELSERPSAILMVQKARKDGLPFWNKSREPSGNQVVIAFEAFQQLSRVSIRPMTAISALSSIHEDICASAERKRAAIILLPYHKHQRIDGALETTRNEFWLVNKRVLEHAPCSVGIVVDRGLGGSSHVSASNVSSSITVLFFGGPDDREALAYGKRMAEHPGISLVVVRFLVSPEVGGEIVRVNIDRSLTGTGRSASEAEETFLAEFKLASEENRSITYLERQIKGPGEVIESIKQHSRCNLFLVGRAPEGQLAASLNVKSDCLELGPVAGLLTSPEFLTVASVLVIQKYHGTNSSEPTPSRETEVVPED